MIVQQVITDDLSAWRDRFEAALHALPANGDGSHDLSHYRRVWSLAQRIAAGVTGPVDRLVVLAAAYFHDVVSIEKSDPRRAQASLLAAEQARTMLAAMEFPADRIEAVAHAIHAHSFSAGVPPETIEAKIIQDADRIEALGAIGIARTFYVAGRMGSQLFHPDDPLGESRPHDDRTYAVDHFFLKMLRLPDTMQTEPGRAIAHERAAVVARFLDDLAAETAPGFDALR